MSMKQNLQRRLGWLLAAVVTTAFSHAANAVPSYARQTGQDCVACHIGGFGPQLTPYGIKFKLGGYTDSDGKDGKVPLSGMVAASYTNNKDKSVDAGHKSALDEASLFVAGKLADKLGTFIQITNEPADHHTALDQVDIRYAVPLTLAGKDSIVGLSVNNNPGVQDPFNNLSPWSFPYQPSHGGNAVGAERAGLGGLEGNVIGANVYTIWDNAVYGELGLYNTLSPTVQSKTGVASLQDAVDFGRLNNALYWRLGYMQDLRTSAWSVGLVGFDGKVKDRGGNTTFSNFSDIGVDASYQLLGTREHIVTVNGSYIREHDSVSGVNTNDYKLTSSYVYRNTYGATLGLFKATASDHQNQNSGYILQADFTPWGKESSWAEPWANLRLGAQYVGYSSYTEEGTKFKASDKNTLYLFAWTSF